MMYANKLTLKTTCEQSLYNYTDIRLCDPTSPLFKLCEKKIVMPFFLVVLLVFKCTCVHRHCNYIAFVESISAFSAGERCLDSRKFEFYET